MNLVLMKNSTTLHSNFMFIYRSTKVKCPFCDAVSNSIVEYRPSLIGYLITILCMLLFGLIGFIMLPVLVNLTKSAIHRCAKCLNEVKTNSIFGFSSMDDLVISYQFGNFGIILTRKMLLYLAVVITFMLAIYAFVIVKSNHEDELGKSNAFIYNFN